MTTDNATLSSFSDRARALKQRVALSRVFQHHDITLKPSGREWRGLCPFHDDATPSLNINDEKGVYLCRACGATGDHITATAELEALSPSDALERLCQAFAPSLAHTGPDAPMRRTADTKAGSTDTHAAGRAVIDAAAQYFAHGYINSPAHQHLARRGFSDATAEVFTLGYAPPRYHLASTLMQYLPPEWASTLTHEAVEELAVETGLLSEREGRRWPFFRHRLIFPILDQANEIVGFAGRALEADQSPKYLNTPDTRWFSKASSVFATPAPDRDQPGFIVEGYTDVLALYEAGGGVGAAATMGTAFSEPHARALARWHRGLLVVGLDPDQAGEWACSKVIDACARIIVDGQPLLRFHWPEAMDPGAVIERDGPGAVADLIGDHSRYDDACQWLIQRQLKAIEAPPESFAYLAERESLTQYWHQALADNAPVTAELVRQWIRDSNASSAGEPDDSPGWLEGLAQRLRYYPDSAHYLAAAAAERASDHECRAILTTLRETPQRVTPEPLALALVVGCALTLAGKASAAGQGGWSQLAQQALAQGAPVEMVGNLRPTPGTSQKKPAGSTLDGLCWDEADQLIRLGLTQFRVRPLWWQGG